MKKLATFTAAAVFLLGLASPALAGGASVSNGGSWHCSMIFDFDVTPVAGGPGILQAMINHDTSEGARLEAVKVLEKVVDEGGGLICRAAVGNLVVGADGAGLVDVCQNDGGEFGETTLQASPCGIPAPSINSSFP